MEEKYEFITRTLYLIGEKLKDNLQDEGTLDEMINKTKEILKEIYK
jgi:hypothetical protein